MCVEFPFMVLEVSGSDKWKKNLPYLTLLGQLKTSCDFSFSFTLSLQLPTSNVFLGITTSISYNLP